MNSLVIDLIKLTGADGFAINGVEAGDNCGGAVDGLGDVNGDEIDDFIIGARSANGGIGESYVVFGSKQVWPSSINLADLDGSDGFSIHGRAIRGDSGTSVSAAGYINGDDIADILIGAPSVGGNVGQSYIVFGSKDPWPRAMNISNLNGNNGFTITGINADDNSGYAVSCAGDVNGDVNGDGIDDIIIGAPDANSENGQSYIIFGEGK